MASKIVMGVNFALGAVLTGISLNIMEKTRKCTDVAFQRALEGILVVSVSLLVASIAYIICHVTCKCEDEGGLSRTLFALYFLGLGIVLIVLGAIMQSKSKGQCSEAKGGAVTTWTLGIVVTLSSVAFFVFENREAVAASIGAAAAGVAKKAESPKKGAPKFF